MNGRREVEKMVVVAKTAIPGQSEQGQSDQARGEQVDEPFKALASAQRREILRILGEEDGSSVKTCCGPGEVCACKIAERLGLAASTISHHMTLLCKAGLVRARKEGQWVYYSLHREGLDRIIEELRRF